MNNLWKRSAGQREKRCEKAKTRKAKNRQPRSLESVLSGPGRYFFTLSFFHTFFHTVVHAAPRTFFTCFSRDLFFAFSFFRVCQFSGFRLFALFVFSCFHCFVFSIFRVFTFSGFRFFACVGWGPLILHSGVARSTLSGLASR